MRPHILFAIAALLGGLAVLLGAFGAHGLKAIFTTAELATYKTATDYLMYHALALLGVAAMWRQVTHPNSFMWVSFIMLLGIALFSGSLYLLLFTGLRWVAWLTPFGGLLLVFAWLLLAWQGLRMCKRIDET